MSWRTGSKLFLEIWPSIKVNITDQEERVRFTADLIRVFVNEDMDTWDIEDVHPDIRAAIVRAGYEICEPERYPKG
jgi:hypothetical protein